MLTIDYEFCKGILFIRLSGKLNEVTTKSLYLEVSDVISYIGIKNIVFNMEQLTYIDTFGINAILYNLELCKSKTGKAILCNIDNELIKEKLKTKKFSIESVSNELKAFESFQF